MARQNVVGDQVRKLRSLRDWSQNELAARCNLLGWDISRGTLSKIEAGLRLVIDSEAYVLAKALDVSLLDLFPPEQDVMNSVRNP